MSNRKRIVLYFTKGANPTEEDYRVMNSIPGARQRNAELIDPEDKPERCDAVAGPAIPEQYKHLPVAKGVEVQIEDQDEGSGSDDPNDMSVKELKAALDELEVEYPASAKKAELVAIYEANVE